MKLQPHWYLGFLGFVGLYKIPLWWAVFRGGAHWLELSNILWFLWFLYFLPEPDTQSSSDKKL